VGDVFLRFTQPFFCDILRYVTMFASLIAPSGTTGASLGLCSDSDILFRLSIMLVCVFVPTETYAIIEEQQNTSNNKT
jgi:hypothetical protein